jgi:hypothetical protein
VNEAPSRSNFNRLRQLIEHGWRKLNEDGLHTVGKPPYFDLYGAVRALDQRFPVQPNLGPIFLKLAHTIAELYPERVREPELITSTRRESSWLSLMTMREQHRTTRCGC